MSKDISIKCSSLTSTLLAVLFIGLKLTNHIDWSWWWVLAPIWIPIVIGLIIFLLIFIGYVFLNK